MRKTYVVFVGRKPGVYENWEEAQLQVNKYSGASHKSYWSREEALKSFDEYMKKQSGGAATFNSDEAKCSSSSDASSSGKPRDYERVAQLVEAQMELERENRKNALRMEELSKELKEILQSLQLGEDK